MNAGSGLGLVFRWKANIAFEYWVLPVGIRRDMRDGTENFLGRVKSRGQA